MLDAPGGSRDDHNVRIATGFLRQETWMHVAQSRASPWVLCQTQAALLKTIVLPWMSTGLLEKLEGCRTFEKGSRLQCPACVKVYHG